MRVLLYTGKGGVGKTTVAAATAYRCAALGHRTLILSTDTAHSLGDVLEKQIGPEVVQVAPRLWAQEVDSLYQLEKYWGKLKHYIVTLFQARGLEGVAAEELANLPGMEEIASLLELRLHTQSRKYDVIVIDCAPTGETMHLLSFPEMARWWLDKFFPISRQVARIVRPVVQPLLEIPLPSDEVMVAARDLILDVEGIREVLADAKGTSIRLVLNLEKMVIKEAQRAFTYFNLFGYTTDLIIVNRVLGDDVGDSSLAGWKRAQEKYRALVDEAFSPLPIRSVPLYDREAVGTKMLARVAADLFDEDDPAARFYVGSPQQIEKRDGAYVLTLTLPFVTKDQVQVLQSGGELTVKVGGYKRNVILPRALVGLEAGEARFRGQNLAIAFRRRSARG